MLSVLQGGVYLPEQQERRVPELRDDLCELHGFFFNAFLVRDNDGDGRVEEVEQSTQIETEGEEWGTTVWKNLH